LEEYLPGRLLPEALFWLKSSSSFEIDLGAFSGFSFWETEVLFSNMECDEESGIKVRIGDLSAPD